MATVTGSLSNLNFTAQTARVTFERLTIPDVVSGYIVNGIPVGATPDEDGAFSLQLHGGVYRLFPNYSDGFYILIEVPDDAGTYDAAEIVIESTSSSGGGATTIGYTLATLRAKTSHIADELVFMFHFTTAGDGGAGNFRYSTTSEAADDNGLSTVKPTNVASDAPGRWLRVS